MDDEILEIVNEEGEVLGLAPRSEIHGNPSLWHRVVHVLVFNRKGELLLQKRSMDKDVAPGRWDTSVGGHVNPGESLVKAAARELMEELGVEAEPEFVYSRPCQPLRDRGGPHLHLQARRGLRLQQGGDRRGPFLEHRGDNGTDGWPHPER